MPETLKEWALYYSDMGLAVFPLLPRDKRPATENGCKAATTDKHKISDWWDKHPDSNIGIATGSISGGLVVIDLDVDENKGINGYEVFKEWQQENGELPESWQSITGRGGYHLFYRDSAVNHNRVGLYDGIDIRGEGGYIVAPPSIHPNGRRYEWEQEPGEYELAQVNSRVVSFLTGKVPEDCGKQSFSMPDMIPEGQRTSALVSLIGSLKAKGLDNEAIKAAVRAENERKCNPPLTDWELEKTVFPALKRGWKTTEPYYGKVTCKDGIFRPAACSNNLEMVSMTEVEEKMPEWLITDYLPKYQITVMAGDGGSGKTTAWCAMAAAVSSGKKSFLEQYIPDDFAIFEPEKVLFFSSEDSFEYTLKGRLKKNGANVSNIYSISLKDERFSEIKFNSPLLEKLIEKYRPALVIFDPIQSFIPSDIQMGQRNAMRACLNPLIGLGEKYKTTFLIIVHANKQQGVYGRKRIADSADIWDIARSVLLVGQTQQKGIRYISHEKSNYGPTGETVLFSIQDGLVKFEGYTDKKDRDYVSENDYLTHQQPQRDEAKEFVLEYLKDGEKESADLDAAAKAMSIGNGTLKRAKSELRASGLIKYQSRGYGKEKKFYVSLIPSENLIQ